VADGPNRPPGDPNRPDGTGGDGTGSGNGNGDGSGGDGSGGTGNPNGADDNQGETESEDEEDQTDTTTPSTPGLSISLAVGNTTDTSVTLNATVVPGVPVGHRVIWIVKGMPSGSQSIRATSTSASSASVADSFDGSLDGSSTPEAPAPDAAPDTTRPEHRLQTGEIQATIDGGTAGLQLSATFTRQESTDIEVRVKLLGPGDRVAAESGWVKVDKKRPAPQPQNQNSNPWGQQQPQQMILPNANQILRGF
jgi:hypothetical protein